MTSCRAYFKSEKIANLVLDTLVGLGYFPALSRNPSFFTVVW